jgi:hypothetical protein
MGDLDLQAAGAQALGQDLDKLYLVVNQEYSVSRHQLPPPAPGASASESGKIASRRLYGMKNTRRPPSSGVPRTAPPAACTSAVISASRPSATSLHGRIALEGYHRTGGSG